LSPVLFPTYQHRPQNMCGLAEVVYLMPFGLRAPDPVVGRQMTSDCALGGSSKDHAMTLFTSQDTLVVRELVHHFSALISRNLQA
jgi:hypothetical protein